MNFHEFMNLFHFIMNIFYVLFLSYLGSGSGNPFFISDPEPCWLVLGCNCSLSFIKFQVWNKFSQGGQQILQVLEIQKNG